jgi:hypothetical protein
VTWQILIASTWVRTGKLDALLSHLAPQIEPYAGEVGVLIARDDCTEPIGDKRTSLVEAATAEYVSFLDDDDWVPDNFIERIVDALASKPDYVGWRMQVIHDGRPLKPTFHSLRYQGWDEDEHGFYRNVSHLNPIRRELALLGLPFPSRYPEDGEWAAKVWQTGQVEREVFIDEPMYEYRTGSGVSLHDPSVERHAEWSPLPFYDFVSHLASNGAVVRDSEYV